MPSIRRAAPQAVCAAAASTPRKSNPALPAAHALDQGSAGPEPAHFLSDQGAAEAVQGGDQVQLQAPDTPGRVHNLS